MPAERAAKHLDDRLKIVEGRIRTARNQMAEGFGQGDMSEALFLKLDEILRGDD
jgi:hypothetical protein